MTLPTHDYQFWVTDRILLNPHMSLAQHTPHLSKRALFIQHARLPLYLIKLLATYMWHVSRIIYQKHSIWNMLRDKTKEISVNTSEVATWALYLYCFYMIKYTCNVTKRLLRHTICQYGVFNSLFLKTQTRGVLPKHVSDNLLLIPVKTNEPRHDKTNKMSVRPAKTPISLGISPVWSESSLSAWSKLGSLATHWAHSEDSDQTGRMPRLIRLGRCPGWSESSLGAQTLCWFCHVAAHLLLIPVKTNDMT